MTEVTEEDVPPQAESVETPMPDRAVSLPAAPAAQSTAVDAIAPMAPAESAQASEPAHPVPEASAKKTTAIAAAEPWHRRALRALW